MIISIIRKELNFMKLLSQKNIKNSQTPRGTILLYIAGAVTLLLAISSLVMNIILFQKTLEQYVAQGYPSSEVLKQLIPVQLLPGLFEAIALYAGMAFVLFAAGSINKKVSQSLIPSAQSDMDTDAAELTKNIPEAVLENVEVNVIVPVVATDYEEKSTDAETTDQDNQSK
jgi:hypothetical protein